ncbi:MAG: sigma 54-interacting transcriptional regulator [Bacteroidales bacterium]
MVETDFPDRHDPAGDLAAIGTARDADNPATQLSDALTHLSAQLDADRIAFVALSGDEVTIEEAYTFAGARDVSVVPIGSTYCLPWYAASLAAGNIVAFTDPKQLPIEAPTERAFFEQHGFRAHLAVPVMGSSGRRYGLGITSFHEHAAWDAAAAPFLRALAALFAAARERSHAEQQAAEALRFERLLADVASSLAAVETGDLVARFEDALRQVVLALGYDRGNVSELLADRSAFVPIASWARPGIQPHAQPLSSRALPWYVAELLAKRMVCLSQTPGQLPEDALSERAFVTALGMKAHVALPLVAGADVIGFVALASMTHYVEWPESIFNRLRTLGSLFASTIVRARNRREIAELAERLEAENLTLRTEIEQERGFEEMVGKSAPLQRTFSLIAQVAPTDATVLVTGETGTGKELVARAIHRRSPRASRPLVTLNCAALPSGLVESELFGYEQGAFTGALARKIGRFEAVDHGTIFLDEIGDLPLDLQAKLLRVLQEGEFERLGSTVTRKVDVRVIAATNQDLERAVAERRFRPDLFYRLSVFPIPVPALRDRREDIPLLVWYFVHKRQAAFRRSFTQVSRRLLRAFDEYAWPGNVRELEHTVERAMILSKGHTLRLDDFGNRRDHSRASSRTLDVVERDHITQVLEACHWRINGEGNAAERLGLHPSTVRFRMKKLGIKRPTTARGRRAGR